MVLEEEIAAAILTPFGGEDGPTGLDGRQDMGSTGDAFRELRAERKAIVKSEQMAARDEQATVNEDQWGWDQVAETAIAYLTDKSKDLDVMSTLIEAQLRLHGAAGLESSMALLARFVATFWDEGLYPREDEDEGVDARFRALSDLSGSDRDGALISPLRRMPLVGGLTLSDKLSADALFSKAQAATTDEQRTKLAEAATEAQDALAAAAAGVPIAEVRQVIARLAAAEDGWRVAISHISERTKPRFPAASMVSGELGAMRTWLGALFRERLSEAPDEVAEETAGADTPDTAAPARPGVIASREQALATMLAVADFFEKTEPLAPTGPALREVCRRARMTFRDLLAELLPETTTRNDYYLRSGIRPPE